MAKASTTKASTTKAEPKEVYVNAFLTESTQIDTVIKDNPHAKIIKHWGNPINVKEYTNGSNTPG